MFVENPRVQLSWRLYNRLIQLDLSVTSFRVMFAYSDVFGH